MNCPECKSVEIDDVLTIWDDGERRCDHIVCLNCGHEWDEVIGYRQENGYQPMYFKDDGPLGDRNTMEREIIAELEGEMNQLAHSLPKVDSHIGGVHSPVSYAQDLGFLNGVTHALRLVRSIIRKHEILS